MHFSLSGVRDLIAETLKSDMEVAEVVKAKMLAY